MSTSWFAMTPGNRLPIPRTWTASGRLPGLQPSALIALPRTTGCTGAAGTGVTPTERTRGHATACPRARSCSTSTLDQGAVGNLDLAALDLVGVAVDVGDGVLARGSHPSGVADAVRLEVVDLVADQRLAVRDRLDHVEGGRVDALQHRGQDVRLSVRGGREVLVGVDTDRPHAVAGLDRGVEDTGARATGGVVDDVSAVVVHRRRQQPCRRPGR